MHCNISNKKKLIEIGCKIVFSNKCLKYNSFFKPF